MKVVVVATSTKCPAVAALKSELIDFDLVIARDDYTYGCTLSHYWRMGEDFVNVEHDVVPWPGAIERLRKCEARWCIHQYPIGHSGKLQSALGIVRFSKRLITEQPDACRGWKDTRWNGLDAQVYGALQIDRGFAPHIHLPPVAHLKDVA